MLRCYRLGKGLLYLTPCRVMSATRCVWVQPRPWPCEQDEGLKWRGGRLPALLILGAARLPVLSCLLMLSLLRDMYVSGGGSRPSRVFPLSAWECWRLAQLPGTVGAFPFGEGSCLGLETHQQSSGKILLAQMRLQSLDLGLLRLVATMFRPKSSFAYSPLFPV